LFLPLYNDQKKTADQLEDLLEKKEVLDVGFWMKFFLNQVLGSM